MKRFFVHNAFFRLLAPLIYGILIYLLILLINNNVSQVNDFFSSEELYICIGLTYISFELCRLLILVFDRLVPEHFFRLRILLQPLSSILLSVGIVILFLTQYFSLYIGFSISIMQLVIFSVTYTVTVLLYNLLYFSNYYLQRENTVKLTAERNQHHVLEMEMTEFRNDINPELLFESLESLISLMYRDVEKAEAYIDNLANAYRYVLTNRQEELVPVSQELEAARNVIAILNEKYFGHLKFESALDDSELQAMLIPGTLPLIVEALVRNTIVSRFEPLIIRCYLEDDYITVQSKLNDRLAQPQQQAALARLQKSYGLYSDRPMIRVKAYDENYIKLPIINVAEEIALNR
ncbi:histidine kinase [Chryseolinea sp. T2]|uniref:histidine kinase n=1 Tax=Chryseolinea sp. T2 TaxID=3129255 RepID=UPI003076C393